MYRIGGLAPTSKLSSIKSAVHRILQGKIGLNCTTFTTRVVEPGSVISAEYVRLKPLIQISTVIHAHDAFGRGVCVCAYTRLTHSFLLTGDDLPECGTCQCPLTVKHILVECVDLNDVRNKQFVASSIKDLFDTIEAHKIMDFIKETRFYKQL